MPKTRAELLDLREATSRVIFASEKWEDSYTKSPKTFKRLVDAQARLDRDLAEYLYGLSTDRIDQLVNWPEVQRRVQAAADVVSPASDGIWKVEAKLLYAVLDDNIEELVSIGGQAGEFIYESPVGLDRASDLVQTAARKYVGELVSGITDTTRDILRDTINRSLAQGEDTTALTDRIKDVINNPVRAEMIAQTESVNSYQLGLELFGQESGATSREWEARANACKLCSPLDGKTLPLDKPFVLPNGKEVMRPAAHPRCRCGLIYNYD